jgi:hypothetical protein
MFRLKLALLYFITIILVVMIMWVIIDDNRDKHVNDQLFPSLESASVSYDFMAQQRISRLKEHALGMLASDLPMYMGLLSKHRDRIRDIQTKTRQEFPNRSRTSPTRLVEFVYQEASELLGDVATQIDSNATKVLEVEHGYAQFVRNYIWESCLAEQSPYAVCFFKQMWLPVTQILLPVLKEQMGRTFPELFVLLDDTNTARIVFDNLHASVDKLRVREVEGASFESSIDEAMFEAGTRYKDHIIENFEQIAPVLKKLDEPGGTGIISSHLTLNEDKVYVIVAARVRAPNGTNLGAFIIGYELGTGLAWEETAAVLGIRPVLQSCFNAHISKDENVTLNEALCDYEMSKQENGVTYVFRNRQGQTMRAGTSLPQSTANQLVQKSTELGPEATNVTESLLAKSISMPTDYSPLGESVRAILTVDLEAAVSPFSTMKFILIVVGIIIFLIGMIVVQVLARSFAKPFEEIDRGIHEIIGGNFEYSFPFNFRDELPRSMAQSLSIMKAVLLGLPLPEDIERDDSWASSLRVEGESVVGELTTETSPDVPVDEVKASEVKESANEYYRRVFKEYVDAKSKLGEDTSKITYIKFVEKIAKTEKSMRERLGCKQVHFSVQVKDNQVILHPIKVIDG